MCELCTSGNGTACTLCTGGRTCPPCAMRLAAETTRGMRMLVTYLEKQAAFSAWLDRRPA